MRDNRRHLVAKVSKFNQGKNDKLKRLVLRGINFGLPSTTNQVRRAFQLTLHKLTLDWSQSQSPVIRPEIILDFHVTQFLCDRSWWTANIGDIAKASASQF